MIIDTGLIPTDLSLKSPGEISILIWRAVPIKVAICYQSSPEGVVSTARGFIRVSAPRGLVYIRIPLFGRLHDLFVAKILDFLVFYGIEASVDILALSPEGSSDSIDKDACQHERFERALVLNAYMDGVVVIENDRLQRR